MTFSNITCTTKTNTNSEYHADVDILSSSMLKTALESPAAYIQSLLDCHKTTPAMNLGSLLHALVLEPGAVPDLVAIYPDDLNRTKDCLSFKEANKSRFCLSMTDFIKAKKLAEKTLESKFRGRSFFKFVEEGIKERSIYYTDPTTGLKCRVRPDLDHPEFTFDLKTTRFCDTERFSNQATALNYDLSAYMYSYAILLLHKTFNASPEVKPKPFILIPVCTEAPHTIFFMSTSNNFLINGMKKYQYALSVIASCAKVQAWPTYGGEEEIAISPWNSFTPPSVASLTANA